MDDDEDVFRRAMASLGVRSLAHRPRREDRTAKPAAEPEASEAPDEEDSLFLASMKGLVRLPDKDRLAEEGAAGDVSRRRVARRLKASESRNVRPAATLDLHGLTAEEASVRLERFVADSAAERLAAVRVVTGKGLRSAGGVAVLKEAVERWLRGGGARWVRAFSEAPRSLGGRGAFILYLRRR